MPRLTNDQIQAELDAIEAVVVASAGGISRRELEETLETATGRNPTWRTLLRRLESLIAQRKVHVQGSGKNATYMPGPSTEQTEQQEHEQGYVPVTPAAARIRTLVRRPTSERNPVGYEESLLEKYRPATTWYLDQPLRKRLCELGRTPDAERAAGTYAKDIYSRLLIDLAWASSRLEGNTYTRLDTQNLLEFGQRAEGKDASEAQMILNHKAAIDLLVNQAEEIGFNLFTFRNLHAALSENLLGDAGDEGRVRSRSVNISGTTYVPLAIPQKIEEHFRTILSKAGAIPDPLEQAFFIMVHIPYLQPFADVNKRTSRLGANISLIKANLCPLSFIDVPQKAYIEGLIGVYETRRVDLLRDVFVFAYERSAAQYRVVRESLGEPDPIRLRFRAELAEAVQYVVLSGQPPNKAALRVWAEEHRIDHQTIDAFVERALMLLLDLHEGNLTRYRLRPPEFIAWRESFVWSKTPKRIIRTNTKEAVTE